MSLCTVTELRGALGIGSLYTDATLQEVCDAADAVLLPMLWQGNYCAVERSIVDGVCVLGMDQYTGGRFHVGQVVTVANCGSHFNGSKTLTAVGEYSIKFAPSDGPADFSPVALAPYGMVTTAQTYDYTDDDAVQLAALMIATDIWQARNSAGMGSIGVDGTPIPYRLGNTLLGKVRGLISHLLQPGGMVG